LAGLNLSEAYLKTHDSISDDDRMIERRRFTYHDCVAFLGTAEPANI
jgi:hypothetical protein